MPGHAYPVDLNPPDITPYRKGNTGVDYVTTMRTARAGPHVMVSGVIHGNELCGAIALDFLFRQGIKPLCGQLTLAFANVAAYQAFDRQHPMAARFVDEDMNRVWSADTLDGPRRSTELLRARELRPLVDRVDFLLDLHSMQHDSEPLALCGRLAKGRRLAIAVGAPAFVVSDAGHAAGIRLRDYGDFSISKSAKAALLLECGQHWKPQTAQMAIECTLRFLLSLQVIEPDFAAPHLPEDPPLQRIVEVTEAVTIRDEPFIFADDYHGLEVIEQAGTLIGHDGKREIRTPYDNCVLVMPSQRLSKGLTAVRFGRLAP